MQQVYFDENFARFIAHVQGDGCFSLERNEARYFNIEMDLINDFINSVSKTFGVKCYKIYEGKTCFHTGIRNKEIAKFLNQYSFGSKTWFIPDFVLTGTDKIKIAYLQAFFDDEGSVIFGKRKWGYNRAIQMQSINKKGLLQISNILLTLGIESNFHGPYKEKYYELKITHKDNIKLFREKINFVHKRKRRLLDDCIKTYQN
jgi:intein/homing endonuclease